MELRELTNNFIEAKRVYTGEYLKKLKELLKESGLEGKTVCDLEHGKNKGVLKVEPSNYSPAEINFYPLKKDGQVSSVRKGYFFVFSSYSDEYIISELQKRFEVTE